MKRIFDCPLSGGQEYKRHKAGNKRIKTTTDIQLPEEQFPFYMKTKYTQEFKQSHSTKLYTSKSGHKKKTTLYTVDSLESFFTFGKVKHRYKSLMSLDGKQLRIKRKMLAKDLQHIESVFLTTRTVGHPVFQLIVQIKKASPTASIIVQCEQLYQGTCRLIQDEYGFKVLSNRDPSLVIKSIKEYSVPLFYCRPSSAPNVSCGNHHKISLIKYKKRMQGNGAVDGEDIRIMISTFNLGFDDWERGTNMAWVGQYDIDNETEGHYANVKENPYYQNLLGQNLNLEFLKSLELIFHQQQQMGVFKCLHIPLTKIKAENINFVLVPNNQQISGFNIIQKYCSKYHIHETMKQKQIKSCELHISVPNYAKCSFSLLSKLSSSFLKDSGFEDKTCKKLYSPIAYQIYRKLKRHEKSNFLKYDLEAADKTFLTDETFFRKLVGIDAVQPSEERQKKLCSVHSYKRDFNSNHLPHGVDPNLKKLEGSIYNHWKGYSVFFKDQSGEIIEDRNIFFLGSPNLTKSAWSFDNPWKCNYELGLLFFDVPGLKDQVLPIELNFQDQVGISMHAEDDLKLCPINMFPFKIWREKFLLSKQKKFHDDFSRLLKWRFQQQNPDLIMALGYPLVSKAAPTCQSFNKNYKIFKRQHIPQDKLRKRINKFHQKSQKIRQQFTDRLNNPCRQFCQQLGLEVLMTADAVVMTKEGEYVIKIIRIRSQYSNNHGDMSGKKSQTVEKIMTNIHSQSRMKRLQFLEIQANKDTFLSIILNLPVDLLMQEWDISQDSQQDSEF